MKNHKWVFFIVIVGILMSDFEPEALFPIFTFGHEDIISKQYPYLVYVSEVQGQNEYVDVNREIITRIDDFDQQLILTMLQKENEEYERIAKEKEMGNQLLVAKGEEENKATKDEENGKGKKKNDGKKKSKRVREEQKEESDIIVNDYEKCLVYDSQRLDSYDELLKEFYTVDSITWADPKLLDYQVLSSQNLTINPQMSGPQILIYHTHSQEMYADSEVGRLETGVVGAGNYLTELLTSQYGYEVLHVTDSYDVPSRDNAYAKALPALEEILRQNPSIEVVIDLHRDEVPKDTHLVTEVGGKQAARFMFFNGLSYTKSTGYLEYLHNDYQVTNLAFSFQMKLKAEEYFPNLTRRNYLKGYRYNMHLCPKTLLVELGAQNNTLEEAKNACEPLAKLLDIVLSDRE